MAQVLRDQLPGGHEDEGWVGNLKQSGEQRISPATLELRVKAML